MQLCYNGTKIWSTLHEDLRTGGSWQQYGVLLHFSRKEGSRGEGLWRNSKHILRVKYSSFRKSRRLRGYYENTAEPDRRQMVRHNTVQKESICLQSDCGKNSWSLYVLCWPPSNGSNFFVKTRIYDELLRQKHSHCIWYWLMNTAIKWRNNMAAHAVGFQLPVGLCNNQGSELHALTSSFYKIIKKNIYCLCPGIWNLTRVQVTDVPINSVWNAVCKW